MTYEPANPIDGALDMCGNARVEPAYWACECGHSEKDEPDDNDDEPAA